MMITARILILFSMLGLFQIAHAQDNRFRLRTAQSLNERSLKAGACRTIVNEFVALRDKVDGARFKVVSIEVEPLTSEGSDPYVNRGYISWKESADFAIRFWAHHRLQSMQVEAVFPNWPMFRLPLFFERKIVEPIVSPGLVEHPGKSEAWKIEAGVAFNLSATLIEASVRSTNVRQLALEKIPKRIQTAMTSHDLLMESFNVPTDYTGYYSAVEMGQGGQTKFVSNSYYEVRDPENGMVVGYIHRMIRRDVAEVVTDDVYRQHFASGAGFQERVDDNIFEARYTPDGHRVRLLRRVR